MIIATAEIKLYAPWVHSLKEKRMVVKSLVAKIRNTYNVSAAEVGAQDMHQTIVLGIACVTNSTAVADGMIDSVLRFVEGGTEAEITDVQREFR